MTGLKGFQASTVLNAVITCCRLVQSNLSKFARFLSVTCPKLLLLAGVDRLDRDLTVGQMQGKFQMQVLPNVGHAVHEDSPLEVAHSMAAFLVRHKLVKGKVEMLPTFPGC